MRSNRLTRLALTAVLTLPLFSIQPARADAQAVPPDLLSLVCLDRAYDHVMECRSESDFLWDRIVCGFEGLVEYLFCIIGM